MEYNIPDLISEALSYGFTTAGQLAMDSLIFMPEVRDMCSSDKCRSFNRNWRCPPACGTIEEAAEKVKSYSVGIIIQTIGNMEDEFDFETVEEASRIHKSNLQKLYADLKSKYGDVLPMGAGTCTLCEKCTYPDSPCRRPEESITSMEAYGLWVSKVCEQSNIPYNYGQNKIAYTSCYLLK